MAIAHRLTHRDEVGNESVAGKAPHLFAGAAKPGLHFVGDEEAAGGTYGFDRGTQEAFGIGEYAVAGEDGVDQQPSRTNSILLHVVERAANVPRKNLAGVIAGRAWRRHQPRVAVLCQG